VARWPLSRMDADDGRPEARGEFIDLTTRLARREAELREVYADQSEVRRRLIRAEDRAVKLRWQLDLIHARRSYRALALLRVARRSPAALLRLPAGLLRLLSSPGPRAVRPLDPDFRGREEHTLAGWAAYDRHDYEAAIAQAQAVLDQYPDDYPALDLNQSAHWQRGDVAVALGTLRRMQAIRDSARLAATVRGYVGRARELDPRWQPRIPGPPHPVEPRDGVIMHLVQESIPYQVDSFTTRSSDTVRGQRTAGLDPFVVTSLGFPRTAGLTGFPPVEVIAGTPYHRIDLGADYPARQASDILVTDTAWLAARVGRQQRPAVIHVGAGRRGFETALVGLALREHLHRPLVYEVPGYGEATTAGDVDQAAQGEHCAACRAAEIRCMREADLVVTAADTARREIIAAGVPAHKVAVVPDGHANGQRYQEIYRDLLDRWGVLARGTTPGTPGGGGGGGGTAPGAPGQGGGTT
jgi:tetratricopeptide (TPR) repeat protein